MDESISLNTSEGFISFQADERDLWNIPDYPPSLHEENNEVISSLPEVHNYLYLINTGNYTSKSQFIDAIRATNYDLVLIDAFYENEPYSATEINLLRDKANGGQRLVIAYMSIGEAEDYRWYWQDQWNSSPPVWLGAENPDWEGNYLVHYWDPAWQDLIIHSSDSYLNRILNAGFDGVYLDIVEAYESFE
jgi:cysteinyl-tRNA synthetase, unknown class